MVEKNFEKSLDIKIMDILKEKGEVSFNQLMKNIFPKNSKAIQDNKNDMIKTLTRLSTKGKIINVKTETDKASRWRLTNV